MFINFMKKICPFLSNIISQAYPPKHLLEQGRPITTTKRVGSTRSLFRYFFKCCTYAGVIGVVTKVIVEAFSYQFSDKLKVIEDCGKRCRDLCRDIVPFLTGNKRIKEKVDCENFPPELELYFPLEFPTEMLGEIGKRLASRLDILRFRSVCKLWRSSLPRPTRFPLSVPPPPGCDSQMAYFITEVTLYRREGQRGVEFEEVDRDGKFKGVYNLSCNVKCDLPMTSFIEYPENQRSKISFHCKAHLLRKGLPRMDSHKERVQGQWDLQCDEYVTSKMVLIASTGANEGVNFSYASASDLSVVAHLGSGLMEGRLALLRLGGPHENWHWDTEFCTKVFKAIGTYKGQLCTLDQWGRVFSMDYHSLHMTQVGPPIPFVSLPELHSSPPIWLYGKELFECDGQLHALNVEHTLTTRTIEVYMLSLQHDKWIKIERKPARRIHHIARGTTRM